MNKTKIGWDHYITCVQELAETIAVSELKDFDSIVSVSRGGHIPSGILAYQLNIKFIYSIGITSYIGEDKQPEPLIYQSLPSVFHDKHVLILDEICDTGDTLEIVEREVIQRGCAKPVTAAVFMKKQSTFKPDYFRLLFDSDVWIEMPYD